MNVAKVLFFQGLGLHQHFHAVYQDLTEHVDYNCYILFPLVLLPCIIFMMKKMKKKDESPGCVFQISFYAKFFLALHLLFTNYYWHVGKMVISACVESDNVLEFHSTGKSSHLVEKGAYKMFEHAHVFSTWLTDKSCRLRISLSQIGRRVDWQLLMNWLHDSRQ